MSLTVGFQLPVDKKLAGLVVLSGYLPAAQRFRLTPGLEDIPVFHGHGAADPMVRFQWAEATKSEIEKQVHPNRSPFRCLISLFRVLLVIR